MPTDSGPVVETRQLVRRFGARVAVDHVDLSIYPGEVFGFLGPNGAGKSTLLRMLLGLLSPSAGEIRVLDRSLPRESAAIRSQMGYMTQRFSLYTDLSVEENLEFIGEIYGLEGAELRNRIDEVLKMFGLVERREQRPATLSGGWRQRLALAASALHRPRVLVLDEPTAGVDPESRREFWSLIFDLAADGTTVLVSTHYMDEAVRCHRLCMLLRGRRVGIGAPQALADQLDDRVVEVSARPVERALALLGAHPWVASATQLGNRIHLLLQPGAPKARTLEGEIEHYLEEAGLGAARAEAAEPNLEDVFVALTRGESLRDGEAPS